MTDYGTIIDLSLSPSLAQFKSHLQLSSNTMDTQLTGYLKAAVRRAQRYIGRIITPSTVTLSGALQHSTTLKWVISVTSVSVDGETLSSSSYSLSNGVLTIEDSVTGEFMTVTYTAGYSAVPEDIQQAVLLIAANFFLNRDDQVHTLPTMSSRLLDSYRTWGHGE